MQSLHSRYSAELFDNLSCCSYRCRLVCCTPRLLQAEGMHNLARTARHPAAERRAASLAPCATPKTASSSRVLRSAARPDRSPRWALATCTRSLALPSLLRSKIRPQRCDAGRHCHGVWRHAQSGWKDNLLADKGTRRTASPTAWAMQNGPGNG